MSRFGGTDGGEPAADGAGQEAGGEFDLAAELTRGLKALDNDEDEEDEDEDGEEDEEDEDEDDVRPPPLHLPFPPSVSVTPNVLSPLGSGNAGRRGFGR